MEGSPTDGAFAWYGLGMAHGMGYIRWRPMHGSYSPEMDSEVV